MLMKHHLKLFGFDGLVPTEMATTVWCITHTQTQLFVWMVSPDRNSWLKTPQRPERLESPFYDGWLYVECVCVCARLHVRLHVFELTKVVCL